MTKTAPSSIGLFSLPICPFAAGRSRVVTTPIRGAINYLRSRMLVSLGS